MGLFSFLFKDDIEPQKIIDDPIFGELIWAEDDEAWSGKYNGFEILLSLEKGKAIPSPELKQYALDILNTPNFLINSLNVAKGEFLEEYSNAEEELKSLKYTVIDFYRYKNKTNRIIASLDSSDDYRTWRIEYCGFECEGIGYDT